MKYKLLVILLFLNLLSEAQTLPGLQQKIFLHTSSDTLGQGETLYFAGYSSSRSRALSDQVLYADLVSLASRSVVKRKVLYLEHGTAQGDFYLGMNLAPGAYLLRAYTRWMVNYAHHSVFEKTVLLLPGAAKARVKKEDKTANTKHPADREGYSLTFFPEGGSWIPGRSARFAVRVQTSAGRSSRAKARIFSRSGKQIGQFVTDSLGLGSFFLKSQEEGSYATFQEDKKSQRFALPPFSDSGLALRIRDEGDSVHVEVLQHAPDTSKKVPYLLLARYQGGFFRRASVSVTRDSTLMTLHKKLLPQGLISFELYQGQKLLCQRFILSSGENAAQELSVQADKEYYRDGDSVTLKIQAAPGTRLSLKVGGLPASSPDIKTYLNLLSELKDDDDINNYLKGSDVETLLLTLSSGDLKQISTSDNLPFSYTPEKGMTISGKVLNGKKLLAGANVSLFLKGASGSLLEASKTDSLGRFSFENLVFYGKAQAKLVAMKGTGEKTGRIVLDSTITALPIPILPSDSIGGFSVKQLASHKEVQEEAESRINADGRLLKEVEVKARRSVVLSNGTFRSMHKEQAFTLGQEDLKYKTLTWWLLNHVKGSSAPADSNFNGSENGVVFSCNDFEIVGDVIVPKKRLRFPQFVVNGREYTSEMEEVERAYQQQFFDLHLDQIKSVRVQRLTGFLTTAPGIQVERVLIHLTVKEMPAEKGLLVTEVHGFDENAPYSQSLNRPEKSAYSHLVYWKPDIVTDEKGEATVTFLNSGPGDEIAYELNGVSPGGQMISAANYSEQ